MLSYIVIGILQGIFEWLPISSEGIVALAVQLFSLKVNPIGIALFLHLGTVFAAFFYFRKEWREVLTLRDKQLMRFLLVSTLVSLPVGYVFYKHIKDMALGNTLLLVMGTGLMVTAFFHKARKTLRMDFNFLAVAAGFLQGLAVIPGLSRSGSTIFALSLGGMPPSKVLKMSYMMSVPVIFASSLYLWWNNNNFLIDGWPALISSFLVGFLTLGALIRVSEKINFFKFALTFSLLCFLGAFLQFIF